jgi:hypothetical protein
MLGGGARFDKKRFKEDIEVFQVCTITFPHSSHAEIQNWTSLASAYRTKQLQSQNHRYLLSDPPLYSLTFHLYN